MKQSNRWRTAAGVAGILAWAALAAVWFPVGVRLILAAVGALGLALAAAGRRKEQEALKQESFLRLLNHHRHDWMNELQVLFGYTRLKKYDILPEYMDKIKNAALHDSLLCRLGNVPLIIYLLERRIHTEGCTVEVELEQEIDLRRLKLGQESFYRLVRGMLELLIRHGAASGDSHAAVSIGFDEDGEELLVDFVYQGEADGARLRSQVERFLKGKRNKGMVGVREEEYGEGRSSIVLTLPFQV